EELREEEVRPERAVEDEGVLADPAEARSHGPLPLQYRARVDVGAKARARPERRESIRETAEQVADAVVVVGAARVGGDPPAERRPPVAGRGRWRSIRKREADDRTGPRHETARVETLVAPPREPGHGACGSVGDPAGEKLADGQRCERGAAGEGESERARLGGDPLFPRRHARPLARGGADLAMPERLPRDSTARLPCVAPGADTGRRSRIRLARAACGKVLTTPTALTATMRRQLVAHRLLPDATMPVDAAGTRPRRRR